MPAKSTWLTEICTLRAKSASRSLFCSAMARWLKALMNSPSDPRVKARNSPRIRISRPRKE
ncbi:hypothetical protein D3C72_2526720 [compost metagenome]